MSHQFVEQLHKKAVPIKRLCRVPGVSGSGYYGSRNAPLPALLPA